MKRIMSVRGSLCFLLVVVVVAAIPMAGFGVGVTSWDAFPVPDYEYIFQSARPVEQLSDEVLLLGKMRGGIYRSMDGGRTWTNMAGATTATERYYIADIAFAGMLEGWAVGEYVKDPGPIHQSLIMHTSDGGRTWERQDDGAGSSESMLMSVDCLEDGRAIAAGGSGMIYRTLDGGDTWTSLSAGAMTFYGAAITETPDGMARGMVVGTDGRMYKLTEVPGGMWGTSMVTADLPVPERLDGVDFGGDGTGYVFGWGEFFLKSTDYGNTWKRLTSNAPSSAFHVDRYHDVGFIDADTGWAVGDRDNLLSPGPQALVIFTNDGGATWSRPDVPTSDELGLYSISAVSENEMTAQTSAKTFRMATTTAERLAGADRYATAIAISGALVPVPLADTAVVATGKDFPDALSASGLAGAYDAPLLLVGSSLSTAVEAELARLDVTDVLIVGGTGAVPKAVEDAIEAKGYTVRRIAGTDRYATAQKVAEEIAGVDGYDGRAFIARGDAFPDALAVAPFAYTTKSPVLLVRPNALPLPTMNAIEQIDVKNGVVAGGTGAVGSAVQQQIDALLIANGGVSTERWAGADRYETAAVVAQEGLDANWGTGSFIGVATGANFPDALAGGVGCGMMNGALVLTSPKALNPYAKTFIQDNAIFDTDARVFGGTGVVSEAVLSEIEGAF